MRITGTEDTDYISGTNKDDTIKGGKGSDWFVGLGGNDVLYGGRGDDTFFDSKGADLMFGGKGADTFILRLGTPIDIIADFEPGKDRIAIIDENSHPVGTIDIFERDAATGLSTYDGQNFAIVELAAPSSDDTWLL